MARLIWSPRAIKDLQQACDYIAQNSDRYARVFAQKIVSLIESIPDLPFLGSVSQNTIERIFASAFSTITESSIVYATMLLK
jgi:plasmid stabilization system protein ParE